MLADRITRIAMSPTIAVNARAREMRDSGIDVIDLSVGEPDFPTPKFVKDAAHLALDNDQTRYTPAPGILPLRQAIADKMSRDFGVSYSTDEIIACTGAKQALFNAVLCLIEDGDEVLIPAPYYVSYPPQVVLAGGTPVVIETEAQNDFRLSPDELEKHITKKSKALILCNPNNPTGTAYESEQLKALCECAVSHGLLIVSDEIYEKILFDGRRHTCVASLSPEVRNHSVIVNGLAKSHAMTGWRIGYACAPRAIIEAMTKIQSQSTTHVSTISQHAGIAALEGSDDIVRTMVSEFQARRNLISGQIDALPGFRCPKTHGTFYAFANVEDVINSGFEGISSSKDLALFLLEKAHVAVVPGEGFGAPGYIRMSFAASREILEKAVHRMGQALSQAKASNAHTD